MGDGNELNTDLEETELIQILKCKLSMEGNIVGVVIDAKLSQIFRILTNEDGRHYMSSSFLLKTLKRLPDLKVSRS